MRGKKKARKLEYVSEESLRKLKRGKEREKKMRMRRRIRRRESQRDNVIKKDRDMLGAW